MRSNRSTLGSSLVHMLVGLLIASPILRAGLPEIPPGVAGLDPAKLAKIDQVVEAAITAKQVPGAVVIIGAGGGIVHAKAYGDRAVEPTREAMTRDSIFDMASLTKPVATATAITILIERGKVRLNDPIKKHLPELDKYEKGTITIEQLLRHRSGLIADNPISDFADGPEKAWERIADLKLVHPTDSKFLYSDVNYLILGRVVERASGKSLDQFAMENIFMPLGMTKTSFRPCPADAKTIGDVTKVCPTEREGGAMLRGVVHDPRARALGGVAGHAGLFSTADDLATFAQVMLLGGRTPEGKRIMSGKTHSRTIDPGTTPSGQKRGLGWDVSTPFSSPRGKGFGPESYGHTGFTGTSLWIDPETEMFVIILTSRLHPDGKALSPVALRADIATLAAASIIRDEPTEVEVKPREPGTVDCGIDVLIRQSFAPLRGKKVGLVTNHTGLTRRGVSTIDVLAHAPGVKLVALFSPEHGIRGQVDTEVSDSQDEKTGLPIHSLYGKNRKPTAESLKGVDALVYDIQDIGTRFYTFVSTMGLVLEAAKEAGIPLFVLDRPNPIGGIAVDGPVRDDEFASFIAFHAIPLRHGMTVGELARMFNVERKVDADLHVIACDGWKRGDLYDKTGLMWVNPSPNMRSLTEAMLYPGVGLIEGTNIATGRGTDTPFERVGAPFLDPVVFSRKLSELGLHGVRFIPCRFTPKERQFANQECGGVYIAISDWATFDPIGLGLGLAVVLRSEYHDHWKPEGLTKFLADQPTYQALLDGQSVVQLRNLWQGELRRFLATRAKYLMYEP